MGREQGQEWRKVRQTAGLWNEGQFPEHVAEEDRVVIGSGSQAIFEKTISALCSPAGQLPQ